MANSEQNPPSALNSAVTFYATSVGRSLLDEKHGSTPRFQVVDAIAQQVFVRSVQTEQARQGAACLRIAGEFQKIEEMTVQLRIALKNLSPRSLKIDVQLSRIFHVLLQSLEILFANAHATKESVELELFEADEQLFHFTRALCGEMVALIKADSDLIFDCLNVIRFCQVSEEISDLICSSQIKKGTDHRSIPSHST